MKRVGTIVHGDLTPFRLPATICLAKSRIDFSFRAGGNRQRIQHAIMTHGDDGFLKVFRLYARRAPQCTGAGHAAALGGGG